MMWLQSRRRKRASAAAVPAVPVAPGNVGVYDTGGSIIVSWEDRSSDELGFRLYRNVDNEGYSLFQTLGPDETEFEDFEVQYESLYAYYLKAFNAVGDSAPSNEASLTFGT